MFFEGGGTGQADRKYLLSSRGTERTSVGAGICVEVSSP